MDYLDLDSFRSRYSDITVTAVPAKRQRLDTDQSPEEKVYSPDENSTQTIKNAAPRVEIIPIGVTNRAVLQPHNKSQVQQQQNLTPDAAAYANEYKQVLAKLEYTKYIQAQLQLMSLPNGGASTIETNKTSNIVDAYSNLLGVIAEMQSNLGPAAIGLRAPKERLLRDIAHARVLVRECILFLMRDG